MTGTNELSAWLEGAPMVTPTTNFDFTNWSEGAPVLDIDEASSNPDPPRRRVSIF